MSGLATSLATCCLIERRPGPELQASPQVRSGGDEETRTPNPRLAKAVLCQLSYVPESRLPQRLTAPAG